MNYNENESYANAQMLRGRITSDLEYSHINYGEKFYKTYLSVARLSGVEDIIPLIISERFIATAFPDIKAGSYVDVSGQIRTYNDKSNGRMHLHIYVFVTGGSMISEEECEERFTIDGEVYSCDSISISGYICKPAVYRQTPSGREIADLIIAVNRKYGRSDYIPCIAWGRNAGYVAQLPVGTAISIKGRFQSRQYTKAISESESESRVAYEISISTIDSVSIGNAADR